MSSSSQVSFTVLCAVGGHRNKPTDPAAHDRPDVELYGPVFPQCQAGSGRTLFYKNQLMYSTLNWSHITQGILQFVIKNKHYDVD